MDYLTEDARANRSGVCTPDTPGAKECRLVYRVLKEGTGWSLVEIRLLTGRRHQNTRSRVHAGAPIIGDRNMERPIRGAGDLPSVPLN